MENSDVEVSVIIPVNNGEIYIERTLDSILSQTYTQFEVIVVDDHSTDKTTNIVREYARKDGRIRCVTNRGSSGNAGAGARNYGVSLARGSWIAVCDADDTWAPQKLERQVAYIRSWNKPIPLAVLGTFGFNINENDRKLSAFTAYPTTYAEYQQLMSDGNLPSMFHSSIIFQRNLFILSGGYSNDYVGAEDLEFETRMSEYGVVINIPEYLISYRKHTGSFQLAHTEMQLVNAERVKENVRRRRAGITELGYEEFVENVEAGLSALDKRLFKRKARGKYYYRVGAIYSANGRYARGVFYLAVASIFDANLVATGIRKVLLKVTM